MSSSTSSSLVVLILRSKKKKKKNLNNKTKSVSGMKYIHFPVLHNKMFIFLTNDKPVIKIVQYGIIFLIVIIMEKCQMLWRKILSLSNSHYQSETTFSQKNYFRKKKINYCYGFMPGDFQVICGSMVGENCRSPASSETPVQLFMLIISFLYSKFKYFHSISNIIMLCSNFQFELNYFYFFYSSQIFLWSLASFYSNSNVFIPIKIIMLLNNFLF